MSEILNRFSRFGIPKLHEMLFMSLLVFSISCVPTGPGGDDLQIETGESVDPELVNRPATQLTWGAESVEAGVSYADRALAKWTPSSDAPFFSSQQVHFYSDPLCTNPIGGWRNVAAGKNEKWIENLPHTSTVTYRVKTYTSVNNKISKCSPPITVDLTTRKAPIIVSSCDVTLTQGNSLNCQIVATDLNLQTHTYSLVSDTCGAGNLNMNPTTGLLTWDTDDDDFSTGACSVDVVVTDTDTDTDVQTLNFVLTNLAPTITASNKTILENSGLQVLYSDAQINSSDEGFGVYALDGGQTDCDPALGTLSPINTATGEISFTPTANVNGSCQIAFTFDDQNSANNTATKIVQLTIQSTNVAPTISENCNSSYDEEDAFSCQITSTDGDATDTLTYSTSTANTCAWVDVNAATGAISIFGGGNLNNSHIGTCKLGVQVSDGEATVKTSKDIIVNNQIPTMTLTEVTSLGNLKPYGPILIKADAGVESNEEPHGTYSRVAADSVPDCIVYADSLTVDSVQGTINLKPFDSLDTFGCFIKIHFDDGNGGAVTDEFLLKFNSNNLAPIVVEVTPGVSCEGSVDQDAEYNCELAIDPTSNIDQDPVTWHLDVAGGHDCDWITANDIDADGDVTITPTDDDVGACTLAIRAWDTNEYSNTFTKAITVNNIAPVFTEITTSFTIDEDPDPNVVTLMSDAEIEVTDEGFGVYSLEAPDSGDNCGDNGTLSINVNNGELTFTPDTNYSDDCGFKITFDDGNGASTTRAITVEFNEEPDAPIISNPVDADCYTTLNEDVAVTCTIGLNDPDFEDNHIWTVLSGIDFPSCSWLRFNDATEGVLTGTPTDDHVGICQVRVQVRDKYNLESNILSWNVTINNVQPSILPNPFPDVPIAGTFDEDTGVIVIKDDADVASIDESHGFYSLDTIAVTNPGCHEFGSLEIDTLTGTTRFQPATNWNGNCNVKINFDDQNSVNNLATVTFNVTIDEVDDAPILNLSKCSGSMVQGNNDELTPGSPNGNGYICVPSIEDPDTDDSIDTIDLAILSQSCTDVFEVVESASGDYIKNRANRPNDDDTGTCVLTLQATDNDGLVSDIKTLSINILNEAPLIEIAKPDGTILIDEDSGPGTVILTDNEVSTIDEGFGSYSLGSPESPPSCIDYFEAGGLTIDEDNGELTGQPIANFNGHCFLKIFFNDGNSPNGVASRDIRIDVKSIPDPPSITHTCAANAVQDQQYTCDVNFLDVESNNEFHTFSIPYNHPSNTCDWAIINTVSGQVSGIPQNSDFNGGSCVLRVQVDDGHSGLDASYPNIIFEDITINIDNVDPVFTIALTDVEINEDADPTIIKTHPQVSTNEEGQGDYSIVASTGSPDCQTQQQVLSIDTESGEITYQPTANFNGDCFINVQFDDNSGTTINSEFMVTVKPLHDDLSITSICTGSLNENADFACTATLTDPDSSSEISWGFVSGHSCSWMAIDTSSGIISGRPNDDQVGTCTLAYQATDGVRNSTIKREIITVNNLQPSFPAIATLNIDDNVTNFPLTNFNVNDNQEGFGQYSLNPLATADTGAGIPGGTPNCLDDNSALIDPNSGQLFFTPDSDFPAGNCFLEVVFDDQNSPNNIGTFQALIAVIDADDPPILESLANCPSSVTEDSLYSCTIAITDEETDPANDTTHTLVTNPDNTCGTLSLSSPADNQLTIEFTPNNVQANYKFCNLKFSVTENGAGQVSNVVSKSIQVINVRPAFVGFVNPAAFNEADGTYLIRNDAQMQTTDETDEDAAIIAGVIGTHFGKYSNLTFGSNLCSSFGTVSVDEDNGETTFTPTDPNFIGTCNINVEYNDGTTVENTVEQAIEVTINSAADEPVFNTLTCNTAATEDAEYTCLPSINDPDTDETYTYSFNGNTCTFLSINPSNGFISGTARNIDIINLGGVCQFAIDVNDGTFTTTSPIVNLALTNRTPNINDIQISAQLDRNSIVILDDLEIHNDDEPDGTYTIISQFVRNSNPQINCQAVIAANTNINSGTGALTIDTSASGDGEICDISIQYSDGAGGIENFQVSILADDSLGDIPELNITGGECQDTEALTENVAYTNCTATSHTGITNDNGSTFEYVIDTNTSQTTCPVLSRDGRGLTIDETTGEITGSFINDDVGSCDLVYRAESTTGGDPRKTHRRKMTFNIGNLVPTPIDPGDPGAQNEESTFTVGNIDLGEEISNLNTMYFAAATAPDCRDFGVATATIEADNSGTVTFTPFDNINNTIMTAPCNLNIISDDGNGGTAGFEMAFSVTPTADSPAISPGQVCRTTILQGNTYDCTVEDNDPDIGDTMTWTFAGGHTCGAWLTIPDPSVGQITGTPTNTDVVNPPCQVSLRVQDGSGNSDTVNFNITVTNVSPDITISAIQAINEDDPATAVILDADITNPEEGNGGVYSLDNDDAQIPKCSDNGIISIDANNGEVTYEPSLNFSGDCFGQVEFDDGNSTSPSEKDFVISVTEVNDPPRITTSCDRNTTEGDDFICYLRAVNPEVEEIISWEILNDCGWVNLHNSGVLYGKPAQADIGTCAASIRVQDEENQVTETIHIVVNNRLPTLSINDVLITRTDELATVATEFEVQSNEEGQVGSSYSLDHESTSGVRCFDIAETMTIAANGEIQMQIEEYNFTNSCNIGVRFTDGLNEAFDQFSVTFETEDTHPTIISNCSTLVEQNDLYTCFPKSESIDKTGVTFALHPSTTCDWMNIDAVSGKLYGRPSNEHVGSCYLAFHSLDGTKSSEVVTYTISVENAAPSFDVPGNGNKTIKINSGGENLYSDSDIQSKDEGNGFYFLNPNVTAGSDCRLSGQVILDRDSGAVVFAPNRFFAGSCSFALNFFDLRSRLNTSSKTINVNVDGSNTPPSLTLDCSADATVGVDYNCPFAEADIDGDTISVSKSPRDTCAFLSVSGSEIIGQPTETNIGTCLLSIFAFDGVERSSYYEKTITIPNTIPTLTTPADVTIDEDSDFDIVFANADIQANREGEGGEYYFLAADPSFPQSDCRSQGTYALNYENGEIRFRPNPNFAETCSFRIGFDDGRDNNNIVETVATVLINEIDDQPVIANSCATNANQDTYYTCGLTFQDFDQSSNAVWEKTDRDTCHWLTLGEFTGSLIGTPDNNDVGTCFISVTITTGSGIESLPYEQHLNVIDLVSEFTLPDRQTTEDVAPFNIYSDIEVNAQEEGKGSYYLSSVTSNPGAIPCSDLADITIDSDTGSTNFSPRKDKFGECYLRIGFQENNAAGSIFEAEGYVNIVQQNDAPELKYYCANIVSQDKYFECDPVFFDMDGDAAVNYQANINSCNWLSLDSRTGKLRGTPNNNHIQTCSIRVVASDGTDTSNEAIVTIEVINEPPRLDINDTVIGKNSSFQVLRSDKDVESSEEGFGSYSLTIPNTSPFCTSKGTLGINSSNGEITFAPELNFVGICFVNVAFNDGFGSIVTSEFKVTVNNLNEKPTINESCARTSTEKSTYSCNPTYNDDGVFDTGYTWHLSSHNECGFLSINASTGEISGAPENEYVPGCRAAFYVTDGIDKSNTAFFDLTITNTTPNFSGDFTISNVTGVSEDDDTTLEVILNDCEVQSSDEVVHPDCPGAPNPANNPIRRNGVYSITGSTGSPDCQSKALVVIDNRSGEVSFDPNDNFQGTCSLAIRFDDDHGKGVVQEITVTVDNIDDPPTIASDCIDTTIEQGEGYSCQISATEVDGEAIQSYTPSGCDWVVINQATGALSGTPTDDDVGTCTLNIVAKDANNTDSNILSYDIEVTNIQPTLALNSSNISESSLVQDVFIDSEVQASEEGFGSYSLVPPELSPACTSVGTVNLSPTTGATTFQTTDPDFYGNCYLAIQFDDGNGLANSTFTANTIVRVLNSPDDPSIEYNGTCSGSVNEGSTYACLPSELEDPDVEFGPSSFVIDTGTNHTCNWMDISASTGAINGVPSDDDTGTCVAHITMTDNTNRVAEDQFSVSVNNIAPVFFPIEDAIIDEGTTATTIIRNNDQVRTTDEGNGTYTLSTAGVKDCVINSIANVTVNGASGQVSFSPVDALVADPDIPANDDSCNINILFTDSQGLTATSQFMVHVLVVDAPPVLTANCPANINQGEDYVCGTNPEVTDDGQSFISFLTGPTHSCNWISIDSVSGIVSGNPANNNTGDCILDIRAYDGAFFSNSYIQNVSIANVQPVLTVTPPPVFNEGDPTILNPLDDDDVQSSEEGDGVYSIDPNTASSPSCTEVGAVTINQNNGAITFAPSDPQPNPNQNYSGVCYIKIVFDDLNDDNNIDEAEVELRVTEINDIPTASIAGCNNNPNESAEYVCEPDISDPDNQRLVFSFGDDHDCGSWLKVKQGSGRLYGTPSDDDFGVCVIDLKVSDGLDESNDILNINIANVQPTLVIANTSVSSSASGNIVALSDEQVQSNQEGFGIYSLTTTGENTPCSGTAVSNIAIDSITGKVTLNANSFVGTCDIGIQFNDQNTGNNIVNALAILDFTNTAADLVPVVTVNETLTVLQGDQGISLNGFLKAKDFENAPNNIEFTLITLPEYGVLKFNGSNLNVNDSFSLSELESDLVTYSHDNIYHNDDSFIMNVSNGRGTGETFTFNIEVIDTRRAHGLDQANLIFATDGEEMNDLSENTPKAFFDIGYFGNKITFGNSTENIFGGYIQFPNGNHNYRLATNLAADADFNASNFTIEFYMKSTAVQESFIMATSQYNIATPGTSAQAGWGIKLTDTGTVLFAFDNVAIAEIESDVSVNDGEWHAISIVRDSSDLSIYVDGHAQSASPIDIGSASIAAEDELIIGSNLEVDGLPNGLEALDEFRIYKEKRYNNGDNYLAFTCPSNFVMSAGNIETNHRNPFCVAKYEMKQVDATTPISQAAGLPWDTVSLTDAQTFCQNIGDGYTLINNNQWMTLARDIETVDGNWSNNAFVDINITTKLSQGNSIFEITPRAASTDDNEFCSGLPSQCDDSGSWSESKRTFTLSNGNIIWDLAGNVAEHVLRPSGVLSSNKPGGDTPDDENYDVNEATPTSSFTANEYQPSNIQMSNEANNIGAYYPGDQNFGGALIRGGSSVQSVGDEAGIYSLDIRNGSSQNAGFRCIFFK